jgi:hypothetical protein
MISSILKYRTLPCHRLGIEYNLNILMPTYFNLGTVHNYGHFTQPYKTYVGEGVEVIVWSPARWTFFL